MRRFQFVAFTLALMAGTSAHALTLQEALQKASKDNPILQAKRAEVDSFVQAYKVARGGFFPSLSLEGDWAVDERDPDNSNKINAHPRGVSLVLTQNIYRGGEVLANTRAARNNLMASQSDLRNTEQQLFLQVVQAYIGVLRDQEVVALNNFQVEVLNRQLEATRSRFELGEVTKTDVSQAEARLAAAKANAVQAAGTLVTSRAVFEELVGTAAENLSWPEARADYPNKVADIMDQVLARHPLVEQAIAQLSASKYSVESARSGFLPDVTAQASVGRREGTIGSNDYDERKLMLNASMPLFAGGSNLATYRQAVANENRAQENYQNARRQVQRELVDAFNNYMTTRARLVSLKQSVAANKLALEGVEKETQVGSRTVLDLLDAQAELLNSQVDQTRTRADTLSSAFRLSAAMGRLTAQDMKNFYPDFESPKEPE